MSLGFQHIAFNCRDKSAMERFYVKYFAFRRARVFNPGEPGEFVMLRLGGTCMEFFQAKAGPADRAGEQKVGYKHAAIAVEDVEKTAARMKADGVDIDRVIDCSNVAPGMKVCFFRDPEGNVAELMQG